MRILRLARIVRILRAGRALRSPGLLRRLLTSGKEYAQVLALSGSSPLIGYLLVFASGHAPRSAPLMRGSR